MNRVFVHGGVSGEPKSRLPSLVHSFHEATIAPSALDGVEMAVRALEDDPALNAGYGAVLNRAGRLELDAGIADGARETWAGVAGVAIRHPISLARRVLEDTPHVLLAGAGACRYAQHLGLEELPASTTEQHERWMRAREDGSLELERFGDPEHVDTVGAVAVDDSGRLAAASSTGGVFGKMEGRVGDAPVFGAGVYASRIAAVVGTGVGEVFLETQACLRAGRLIEEGTPPQPACEAIIRELKNRSDVAGGILAIAQDGSVGAAFTGGSWAVEGSAGPIEARLVV